jgi:hypothetical protein
MPQLCYLNIVAGGCYESRAKCRYIDVIASWKESLKMHQKIYIVDDNYVVNSVKKLITIPGEIGLTIKIGLYTGLRQEEIVHLHKTGICSNLGGCTCDKYILIEYHS